VSTGGLVGKAKPLFGDDALYGHSAVAAGRESEKRNGGGKELCPWSYRYLSGLHADRIERSAKGEQCEIKLLFRL
jgi:hypothetical protein